MFGARLARMCKFTYGLLTEDGFRHLLYIQTRIFGICDIEIDGNSVVMCSCNKQRQKNEWLCRRQSTVGIWNQPAST